jgi:hypothetical protein
VEDLYRLVERAASETGAVGVSAGAILSDYQRVRVESVCSRLGLTSLAFLWRRDQVILKERPGWGSNPTSRQILFMRIRVKYFQRLGFGSSLEA